MKKKSQIRKSLAGITLSISLAVWAWISVYVFKGGYFRITYLVGILSLGLLVWAILKSYQEDDSGKLIGAVAMQSWSWAILDYLLGAFLGQNSCAWIPHPDAPAWIIQSVGTVIALCLTVLLFPIAQRIYRKSIRSQRSSAPISKKWVLLSLGGISLISALRSWLWNLENPVVDAWLDAGMFLLALFTFEIVSMTSLLFYFNEAETKDEPAPQIPLL